MTDIHRFDISVPEAAVYQASGEVMGTILGSYALDEHAGDLRVASTTGDGRFGGPVPMGVSTSPAVRSMLTVLRMNGSRLDAIGRLDGLGPNEQIKAVRFVEDRAYVVTFRNTDPLFVIDLTDAAAPRLVGELVEPGVSAYLHPIGEGRMLGIGSAASPDGAVDGVKVELYDTTDPAAPRSLAAVPVNQGSANVAFDTHAFTWDDVHHLAFIPMNRSVQGRSQTGVAVYRVEGDQIAEVAWIDHSAHPVVGTGTDGVPCCVDDVMSAPQVDRVIVVGERAYAISVAGVSQHPLDTFAEAAFVATA